MTGEQAFDAAVRAYLHGDPPDSGARVVREVLGALDAHPQRRSAIGAVAGPRLGSTALAWRKVGAGALIVVGVLLAGLVALPVAFRPTATGTPTPLPLPSSPATARPSTGPSASLSPSASPIETAPSTAPPAPTLDWTNVGMTLGVRSPVAFDTNARVTMSGPVGPVCSISVRYPGGGAAVVPAASHPAPGTWVWTWNVPPSAGLGTATVGTSCVYAGVAKTAEGSFRIVATLPTATPKVTPTPKPSWSITGSVNSPVSVGGTLTFTGHVNGTPPAGNGEIDLNCHLVVTYPGNFDQDVDDPFVNARDFELHLMVGATPPGTLPWKVTCFATLNAGSRSTSGTFVVQ